ncbi:MAG TPA: accessory factor UbiK family protein [Rhodospirillaceae bacterium]|nr:accessory factor UbiK family protein [Rhodospirillaceae bacterium]
MQTDNRLFDDLARMASGALNAVTGLKTEAETLVRQQLESFVSSMNLVTREEFEAVQAMAAKARDEQESLAERLARAEATIASLTAPKAKEATSPAKRKPSAKT